MFNRLIDHISRHRFAIALLTVGILTVIFHVGTFFGLDSDFQGHALRSRLVFLGQNPYVDFFDHKPPLYYFILLPGNLLGAHLVSFFVVHLFYLIILGLLLFYYGWKNFSKDSFAFGFITFFIFMFLTAVQFLRYGNLNGGIIYPVVIFNLLVFIKTFELLSNKNIEIRMWPKKIVFIGFLSGCSFLTRFNITPVLLVAAGFLFLLFIRRFTLGNIIKLGMVYSISFLLPLIVFWLIYQPPLDIIYNQLIVYNYFYSHSEQISSLFFAAIVTIIGFIKYSILPILTCLTGLTIYIVHYGRNTKRITGSVMFLMLIGLPFLLSYESQNPVVFGRYSTNFMVLITAYVTVMVVSLFLTIFSVKTMGFNSRSKIDQRQPSSIYIIFLLIYLTFELLSVVPQKIGMKNYPFFPSFIPITLLSSISLSYISLFFRHPKRIHYVFATSICTLVLIVFFGKVFLYREYFSSRLEWPEKEIVKRIESLIQEQDDLFTIDYCPYIYLETNTIPPIDRFWYYYPKWSIYGTKPNVEEILLSKLVDNPPKLLITYSHNNSNNKPRNYPYPYQLDELLLDYKIIGNYKISYGNQTLVLYLREETVERLDE